MWPISMVVGCFCNYGIFKRWDVFFEYRSGYACHVPSGIRFHCCIYIYIYICVCVCVCVCHCFMVFCLFGNFAKDRSPDYDVCVYLLVAYLFIYYS